MKTQFKIKEQLLFAIFFWLSTSPTAFAQLGWVSSGLPSVWGNVYGVGVPIDIGGDLCNGKKKVYFSYDDAGNRILRTVEGIILKTKKDGVADAKIGGIVEKFASENTFDATTVKVFPNPASDVLIVEQVQAVANGTYELYDAKGEQIITQRADLRTEIDIANLPSGFYLLILRSADATAQWKITKK